MTTLRVLLHIAPQRDYSSPTTASLSRLMLPYLFPDLATFATVADLVAHLNTSDARYRTALPTEDHFLSLCPTELTIDLLEERLTTAEKSILAVGASRGDRRTPFFEGCSPVPLLPSVASAAAVDLVGTEEVGAASAPSGRRRNSKGKGSRVVEGTAGAAAEAVEEAEWVAVEVGVVPGVGASMAAVEVVEAAAEVVEEAAEVVEAAAVVVEVAPAMVLVEVQPRSMEALVVASASSSRVPVRPCRPSSFVSGTLGMGGLGFPDAVELPRWHDLLRQNVAIFDLDFDAILAAMYALTDSAEGDCYLSVPPDPCIEAVALGASASAAPGAGESAAPGISESALSGTAPTEALHTFTLDSGASRSFFRDSTTLMPLSRPVAVSLADPSGGPVLAHSSTVLPCPAALSGLLSRLHLPSFSTNLVSGADLQDAWVAASSQVFAAASRSSPASTPCSCRPLSHETLLWHHHLGHPSLPRLRGMASRTLKSTPVPPSPSSGACPIQSRVRGKGHERYFLLVVDDYSRYTIVFPLRSKGEVPQVLIDWIHGARRQLSERFGSDLPVLRLHLDRGGELSSDLLRAFCRAEGIRQTFTLPASPQQNGIAERRIGMVMDVACTSMIHAVAPHFLWPFAVLYAAHQINLRPRVSLPETTPTLRWTGEVGDASEFRVWGSRAFVRDTSADKLSSRADVMFDESVSYYHPLPLQGPAPSGVSEVDPAEPLEVAVDSGAARGAEPAGAGTGGAEPGSTEPGRVESGGAEPGDPLPLQGPAPSGVSEVDPAEPLEVAVDSGAARGAEPAGAGTGGAEPGSTEPGRVESGGAEPGGA
ncbi:unnamed protein product [Closterium sp. NIES-54]